MPFQWQKYQEWRRHPLLSNNTRHMFPGLGYGLAAFAVYVAYDKAFGTKDSHH